jgi:hypothetical protein
VGGDGAVEGGDPLAHGIDVGPEAVQLAADGLDAAAGVVAPVPAQLLEPGEGGAHLGQLGAGGAHGAGQVVHRGGGPPGPGHEPPGPLDGARLGRVGFVVLARAVGSLTPFAH